jgi:hypothetical protein
MAVAGLWLGSPMTTVREERGVKVKGFVTNCHDPGEVETSVAFIQEGDDGGRDGRCNECPVVVQSLGYLYPAAGNRNYWGIRLIGAMATCVSA